MTAYKLRVFGESEKIHPAEIKEGILLRQIHNYWKLHFSCSAGLTAILLRKCQEPFHHLSLWDVDLSCFQNVMLSQVEGPPLHH